MHDTVFFESNGVPSVACVSSEFQTQAHYQAKILDAEFVQQVFVQHPISDQTREAMHAKAEAVFEQVVRSLTAPSPMAKKAKGTGESIGTRAACST